MDTVPTQPPEPNADAVPGDPGGSPDPGSDDRRPPSLTVVTCVLCGDPATGEVQAKRHPRDYDPPWQPYCLPHERAVYEHRLAPLTDRHGELTRKYTAFKTFAELVGALGNYWPTLRVDGTPDGIERRLLAELYDAVQAARGDTRRAERGPVAP